MNDTPSLDAAAYTKGEAFMQEKAGIFAREWLPLGAVSQLSAEGSFVSATIGGWPLFLIRDAAGELRAMRNACRHQNMMVIEQAEGRCDTIRCRYHGWTYDLSGRFVSAPSLVAPDDPQAPRHHLAQVLVTVWRGVALVNLAEDAAPFEASAEAILALDRAGAPIDPTAVASTDLACNWKVCVEDALASPDDHAFQWPLLVVRDRNGVMTIDQIVPRSFLRTRVITYALSDASAVPTPELSAEIDRMKARCEALQLARAASDPGSGTNAIDAFRARVLEAMGGVPHSTQSQSGQ